MNYLEYTIKNVCKMSNFCHLDHSFAGCVSHLGLRKCYACLSERPGPVWSLITSVALILPSVLPPCYLWCCRPHTLHSAVGLLWPMGCEEPWGKQRLKVQACFCSCTSLSSSRERCTCLASRSWKRMRSTSSRVG